MDYWLSDDDMVVLLQVTTGSTIIQTMDGLLARAALWTNFKDILIKWLK